MDLIFWDFGDYISNTRRFLKMDGWKMKLPFGAKGGKRPISKEANMLVSGSVLNSELRLGFS